MRPSRTAWVSPKSREIVRVKQKDMRRTQRRAGGGPAEDGGGGWSYVATSQGTSRIHYGSKQQRHLRLPVAQFPSLAPPLPSSRLETLTAPWPRGVLRGHWGCLSSGTRSSQEAGWGCGDSGTGKELGSPALEKSPPQTRCVASLSSHHSLRGLSVRH